MNSLDLASCIHRCDCQTFVPFRSIWETCIIGDMELTRTGRSRENFTKKPRRTTQTLSYCCRNLKMNWELSITPTTQINLYTGATFLILGSDLGAMRRVILRAWSLRPSKIPDCYPSLGIGTGNEGRTPLALRPWLFPPTHPCSLRLILTYSMHLCYHNGMISFDITRSFLWSIQIG